MRNEHTYRICDEGGAWTDVDEYTFNAMHGIDGVIRIHEKEYEGIDRALPFYTHFNFEWCGHAIGRRYALPRIIVPGYFRSSNDERPPVLSFKNIVIGECITVQEHVPYTILSADDFVYSMKHIQNMDELKTIIIKRYGKSMPNLSTNDFETRGVAMTIITIIEPSVSL